MLLIQGPRGVGKTSLLQATLARVQAGSAVMQARCHETEREFPFGVVRQLFDPMLDSSGVAPLPTANHARSPMPDLLDDYYQVARSIAATRPAVIAIDDLAQADPQSARWWRYITRRLDGRPVLAIATLDTSSTVSAELVAELETLSYARRIRLEPLCLRCTTAYLCENLVPNSESIAACCHALTQGNPLVLHRLVEALRVESVGQESFTIEQVVRLGAQVLADTTLTWLQRDQPATARLLDNLAVLGPDGDLEMAAIVAGVGEPAAGEARTALREAGILAADAPDRFDHEAIRAAVLAQISPAERRDLHARSAKLLARLGVPAMRIAEHLMSIGPADDPWRVSVLRRAADEATGSGDWDAASRYLRRAAAEIADTEPSVSAELAAVELHRDVRHCFPHLRSVMEGQPDRRELTTLLAPLATPLITLNSAEASQMFTQLATAPSGGEDAAAPDESESLLPFAAQALLSGNRPHFTSALTRAARKHSGFQFLVARALAAATSGRSRIRAARMAQRCIATARAVGADRHWSSTVSALLALCMCWMEYGDESRYWARQAVDMAADRRSTTERGFALAVQAEVARQHGELVPALASAREAMRLMDRSGMASLRAGVAARTVHTLVQRGEWESAEPMLAEVSRTAASHVMLWTAYLEARGLVAQARGNHREALRFYLECGHQLKAHGVTAPSYIRWRSLAVVAHARLGEVGPARTLAAEDLRVAREWGAPGTLSAALVAGSTTTEGPEQLRMLREATEVVDGTECVLESAYALIRLGTALSPTDERAGRSALERGIELATDCGATSIAAWAKRRLGGDPDQDSSAPAPLTHAERRVAELVLHGMNNAEVAANLSISKRTVDTHLGRIYRKLNIRSRSQLADGLARLSEHRAVAAGVVGISPDDGESASYRENHYEFR